LTTQFITNDKGVKTAAIVPINEYEDLLHQHHLNLGLTEEYKNMIYNMLEKVPEKPIMYRLAILKAVFNPNDL